LHAQKNEEGSKARGKNILLEKNIRHLLQQHLKVMRNESRFARDFGGKKRTSRFPNKTQEGLNEDWSSSSATKDDHSLTHSFHCM
jgi:hypothetical protein